MSRPSAHAAQAACRVFVRHARVDGAAFTVMSSDATRETLCASDEVIGQFERLQFDLGDGPTLAAFRSHRPVLIPDLAAPLPAAQWPMFVAEAGALPVGGLFTFPMQLGAITVGVCAAYRRAVGPLSVPELAQVLRAVDAATLSMLRLRSGESAEDLDAAWLQGPRASRHAVHQATGMLIAQLGVHAEEAFARLRAHAFANGKSVEQTAAEILSRQLRLEADPDRI